MENIYLDFLIKIIPLIIAVYQLRNLKLVNRLILKSDLEILKLFDSNDPNIPAVKKRINEKIEDIYIYSTDNKLKVYSPIQLIISISFIGGYLYIANLFFIKGELFWSFLTFLSSLIGIGGIRNSFISPKERHQRVIEYQKRKYGI